MSSSADSVGSTGDLSLTLLARQLHHERGGDPARSDTSQAAGRPAAPIDRFVHRGTDVTQRQHDNLMTAMRTLAERYQTHQALRSQDPSATRSPDADQVDAETVSAAAAPAATATPTPPPAVAPPTPAVPAAPATTGSGNSTSSDPGTTSGDAGGSGSTSDRGTSGS